MEVNSMLINLPEELAEHEGISISTMLTNYSIVMHQMQPVRHSQI